MSTNPPLAVDAYAVPSRAKSSNCPEPFFSRMAKRKKHQLGEVFGLKNFGVNLTRLAPGGESALLHRHSRQDEFVFVLEGEPTLVTDEGEMDLHPGFCTGFPAAGRAHHLPNRTTRDASFSKSAIGQPVTRAPILKTTSAPCWEKAAHGASSIRTAATIEIARPAAWAAIFA